MKHPMQCAKCFRVCRLSDSGKTWVCTICKHREKANGGQAVSDTMCAKTTETSRCQRCGSEFDWISDGTKVHAGKRYFESDSLLCLERQLNAANDRIKRLENIISRASTSFFEDGSDRVVAVAMLMILDEAKEAKP